MAKQSLTLHCKLNMPISQSLLQEHMILNNNKTLHV